LLKIARRSKFAERKTRRSGLLWIFALDLNFKFDCASLTNKVIEKCDDRAKSCFQRCNYSRAKNSSGSFCFVFLFAKFK
jgi:hypothetical protein